MPDTLYAPDGAVTEQTPSNGATYTLEELQGFVGGFVELFSFPTDAGLMLAVVNEDGHRLRLEYNQAASKLCGRPIVGPVLVCPSSRVE